MSSIGRSRYALVSLLAACTLLAMLLPEAWAPAAQAAPAVSADAPVMVVLDASGSMNTSDAPGPRISAAKRAVTGLVNSVPSGAQVGLEVYGTSTGSGAADESAGCRDIKVLVPVGPVDRSSFDTKVAGIKARGYTPIGSSLKAAAAALPKEGARSIVLVSDGEDTCAPPQPCEVAKQLKAQGVELTVHTVGFKVDSSARAQLQCIAASTGGTYHDANDSGALSDQLQKQVEQALRGYQASGIPISGGATAQTATAMSPGQYVDTYARGGASLAETGTVKYYRVQLRAGWTPYFAATIIPPARRLATSFNLIAVQVRLHHGDGSSDCTQGFDEGVSTSGAMSAATGVAVGKPVSAVTCLRPGPAIVEVDRLTDAYRDEPLKMELAFRLEPPADTTGLPGPATQLGKATPPSAGAITRIESGSSFNDAPALAPGRYSDSVVAGETRYVKVHVGWGQRLTYAFEFPHVSGIEGLGQGISMVTEIANPMRDDTDLAIGSRDIYSFVGADPVTVAGTASFIARYTNRDSFGIYAGKYSIDGDYYLVLRTGYGSTGSPTLPYTLDVGVVGTPERGPVYLDDAASSRSASAHATTPSATSPTAPSSSGAVLHGTSASDSGSSTPLVLGIGVAVLALGALGGGLVRRRRRGSGPAAAGPGPTHG